MKLIYNVEDKPQFSERVVFAFQQLLAIMAATIAVPAIVGNGMTASAALFGAGVGTLVYQLFTKFRSPVFLGSSFAFLGSMFAAFAGGVSMSLGFLGLILGAVFAGLVYVVFALIVKASGVLNGTVCIASHHTTCSVMIQECSHDIDSFDIEYLQHDLLDIMRKMIPDFAEEHQYRHPGPIHLQFGRYVNEPGDFTSMNTDGHLRSVFFGRSETMTIKDGVLDGGEFAHIYFVDWDHVRARRRQLNITVMGTTEDLQEDRKWNHGKVIDTLHKFTPEEKADDIHYTLQQKR